MLPELNYKKIFLAILLVAISLGMIFGVVWLIFIRPNANLGGQPGATNQAGGNLPGAETGPSGTTVGSGGRLPGSLETGMETATGEAGATGEPLVIAERAEGSLTKVNSLNDEPVKGVEAQSNGFNYLSATDNKFYRVTATGEKFPLSSEEFPYVEKVSWSPDGNKVVLQYPDGAALSYDFTTGKKTTLPTGLEDPVFDASANNIAYKFITDQAENNWLVVTDANSNQSTAVEAIGEKGDKVQVNWSAANRVVATYRKSVGLEREEIFFIGLNDENNKSFVVDGSNFEGVWSPRGDKILYSVINSANNYNPSLWIADAGMDNAGNNNFNLGLVTWARKCVFARDGQRVYCAVPLGLSEAAGLYPELLYDSGDVFYEINLASGLSKMIAYPTLSENLERFQAKQIFLSDDEKKLFFWDNFSQQVYYLKLK